ncbi:MAG: hypothetical protein H8E12_11860 [Rhodobacteraceae bacterium]|nr:hypothetical protein [Paracoccaceae bacterium]
MNKKGVIFGPWVGEFGWELFAWQGYIRQIAKSFDFVVVIGRPGNNFLYVDFSDIFIPFNPPAGIADSHQNSTFDVGSFNIQQFMQSTIDNDILIKHNWSYLPPTKIGHPPYDSWRASINISPFGEICPDYHFLRSPSNFRSIDIIIHARSRSIREIDNWDINNWNILVEAIQSKSMSIASIGTNEQSKHIDGTIDMRNISIDKTVGLLNSAKCIVGSSSGPMHLAALSGCPQVVWTSNYKQNYSRYRNTWNPFNIKSIMIPNKIPTTSEVLDAITEIIKN